MNKRQSNALKLASLGMRILPVSPNSKVANIEKWQVKATTEISQINAWFEQWPDMNYGVLCGDEVQVLDLDIKNGKNGLSAFSDLCGDDIPRLKGRFLAVSTPSGGFHYYLQAVRGAETRHRPDGIDYQSYRAYVLGPGSVIDGKEYQMLSNSFDLAPRLSDDSIRRLGVFPKVSNEPRGHEANRPSSGIDSVLLREISPDLPYNAWRDTIFAYLNLGGAEEELQAWSEQGATWDEEAYRKVIHSYDPSCETKLGYPRLQQIATQYPVPSKVRIPEPVEDVSKLRNQVLIDLCQLLESYGNRPAKEHCEGLEAIVRTMVNGSYSNEKFRISFPLETGMGKTTSVVALLKSLQHTDRMVLVCAERIDQLGELKDSLISEGVSPSKIGIFHRSDKHRASVPSIAIEALPQVQFLLASHNRIKADTGRATHERLLEVLNRDGTTGKRHLTVWDESLITTKPIYVERAKLREEIGTWKIRFEERKSRLDADVLDRSSELYQFFVEVEEKLLKGADDGDAHFDFSSASQLKRDSSDFLSLVGNFSCLEILLRYYSIGTVRQLSVSTGKVLVQFVAEVDDAFDKIVILDASSRIRDLVRADRSIANFDLPLSKEYSQVTIFQSDTKSSKEALKDFKDREPLYKEAVCILETLPKNEEVLIFTFKDYEEELAQFIRKQHPFRTVHVLHWGQHRASNRYSHIKFLITVGVQYRDPKEIAAALVAQSRNLDTKLVHGQVQKARDSEQGDTVYQAISRGHCRKTFDGEAGEQTIYLLHPDRDWNRVKPILEQQMKGVVFKRYVAKYVPPARMDADNPIKVMSDEIIKFVEQLPEDVELISLAKVRKELGIQESSNSHTWREACKQAKGFLPGFEIYGRSLVRSI
jgi:hypothetical protein